MDVKKYFDRLGLELPDPIVPDSKLLRKVHLAHCCKVPYENLDMIRGIPTSLEEEALYQDFFLRYSTSFPIFSLLSAKKERTRKKDALHVKRSDR